MHTAYNRITLVINSTLLQPSTKLADWPSVIPYLLRMRSLVAGLPWCFGGVTTSTHGPPLCARMYRLRPSKPAAGSIASPGRTGYLYTAAYNLLLYF